MFPLPDLDDDLFLQPKATTEALHSESDVREDFAPATNVDRSSKFNPTCRFNNNRKPPKPSKSRASEGPSSTSKFYDTGDVVADAHVEKFQSELESITKTATTNYEYSQLDSHPVHDESLDVHGLSFSVNDPIESLEIKTRSCFPDYSSEERECIVPMFPLPDLDDDLFHQPKATTDVETLHSESDVREDFAPATNVDRSSKFNPNSRSNNNRKPPKPSKSRASEGPSSTSKFYVNGDVMADAHVGKFQSELESITETATTNYECSQLNSPTLRDESLDVHGLSFSANGPIESLEIKARNCFSAHSSEEMECFVPMFPMPDLSDDLFHEPKTTNDVETLHSESDVLENFAPATNTDRSSKFNPSSRFNNNKIPPKSSKPRASEDLSTTSKFYDTGDDVHVEKFQSELESIIETATSNCEYSQLDSPPLHNESLDVHGLSFSSNGPIESLEIKARSCFPDYSSEERECFGKTNDLEAQFPTENEDLHTIERDHTIYHTEESNFEKCAPSILQNDDGKSSRKVQQGNKKLKTSVDNLANTTQNAKNIISEIDDEYGGNGYKDDDIPKQKKRKLTRKSTNRNCEDEISFKSSKKASEEPGSTFKEPPKKRLLHGSSRCKRAKRQVNKALLEIPDDELDRKQLVIRDLIRLAGFKERILNKEAGFLKNFLGNQSVEHEKDNNGDDANGDIQKEGPRLNYHSYMKRPLQIRWSKTDTEFFYQAIRQFGTDFAMIQVLFPNRSREQVKAKFKNEQRKHPLEIADALVHRSKDHSHFEKVIQHLQAVAEQNSKNNESDPTAQSQQDEADNNEADPTAQSQQDEADHNEDDPTAQSQQDEANQNKDEKMEVDIKDEDQDANLCEDWDVDAHNRTMFSVYGDDFDQHSEATSGVENFWSYLGGQDESQHKKRRAGHKLI